MEIKEKLIVILIYYKMHVTQEFIGDIVGLHQSNISRFLTKALPLIEQAADPGLKTFLEKAKNDTRKREDGVEAFWNKYPEFKSVSTDATEMPIYRSKKYKIQKEDYSGKTKQHALKVQISTAETGQILDVSNSYPGSVHDKTIIDEEGTVKKFDTYIPHRFDSGYQGLKNNNPNYYLTIPTKKPRSKNLSLLEKENNRANSKRRVVVEHAFSRIKKFKISSTVFRQPREKHNQTIRNIVAILNFKLRETPLIMQVF